MKKLVTGLSHSKVGANGQIAFKNVWFVFRVTCQAVNRVINVILKSKRFPINILVLFQEVSRNERKTKVGG